MLSSAIRPESMIDNNTNANTRKTGLLSFGLGWRDKNKVSIFITFVNLSLLRT